jgi:DNA-directed RNA polymerase specialized sigma24 family protein
LTAPRDALRDYIAAPSTRSALNAYARHRGLHDCADDVVQTVLCDALAVEAVPVDAEDVPRWLSGIARHKVADEHRRRTRRSSLEPPEGSTSPDHEAKDLLRRIEGELQEPHDRQALEWLKREHEGEALCEMARAEALAPETLRQRVARFRRKLRARYLVPLGLLLTLAGSATVWRAEQSGALTAPMSANALAAYAGKWRVVAVAPERYQSLDLRVLITPDRVRVLAADGVVERSLTVAGLSPQRVQISSAGRSWTCLLERLDADHFRLSSERGFVLLERQH